MGTEERILHVGFNQDFECFACGTSASFRVFNCSPFQETVRYNYYSHLQSHYLSSILLSTYFRADLSTFPKSSRGHRNHRTAIQMQRASFSRGRSQPQISSKQGLRSPHNPHACMVRHILMPSPWSCCMQVMMWDDHQQKCVGELSFRSQVRAVRLRRDRVVVALGKPCMPLYHKATRA